VIRTGFRALPGPLVVRVLIAVVVVAVALVALHFFYDWLGRTLLDPGGGIG
jgi:hypothetical protein